MASTSPASGSGFENVSGPPGEDERVSLVALARFAEECSPRVEHRDQPLELDLVRDAEGDDRELLERLPTRRSRAASAARDRSPPRRRGTPARTRGRGTPSSRGRCAGTRGSSSPTRYGEGYASAIVVGACLDDGRSRRPCAGGSWSRRSGMSRVTSLKILPGSRKECHAFTAGLVVLPACRRGPFPLFSRPLVRLALLSLASRRRATSVVVALPVPLRGRFDVRHRHARGDRARARAGERGRGGQRAQAQVLYEDDKSSPQEVIEQGPPAHQSRRRRRARWARSRRAARWSAGSSRTRSKYRWSHRRRPRTKSRRTAPTCFAPASPTRSRATPPRATRTTS